MLEIKAHVVRQWSTNRRIGCVNVETCNNSPDKNLAVTNSNGRQDVQGIKLEYQRLDTSKQP